MATPTAAPTDLPIPEPIDLDPAFDPENYAQAMAATLPRGLAWRDEPGDVRGAFRLAIGDMLAAIDRAARQILAGVFPGMVSPFLPEWEATLGLPDPCLGDTPAFADRAAQVRARFIGVGGLSRQRFVDFAATLGFTIEITNYAPFRVGQSTVESPVAGDEWRFILGVTVIDNAGDLSTDVLMCELNAIRPAETTFILLTL